MHTYCLSIARVGCMLTNVSSVTSFEHLSQLVTSCVRVCRPAAAAAAGGCAATGAVPWSQGVLLLRNVRRTMLRRRGICCRRVSFSPSVCLSQVGVLSKRPDGSSCLALMLSSADPTVCYNETRVSTNKGSSLWNSPKLPHYVVCR